MRNNFSWDVATPTPPRVPLYRPVLRHDTRGPSHFVWPEFNGSFRGILDEMYHSRLTDGRREVDSDRVSFRESFKSPRPLFVSGNNRRPPTWNGSRSGSIWIGELKKYLQVGEDERVGLKIGCGAMWISRLLAFFICFSPFAGVLNIRLRLLNDRRCYSLS